MMLNLQHPDTLTNQQQVRSITRGGRQAADSAAMEAMWQALESGKSIKEAKEIFSQTYINVLYGKEILRHSKIMRTDQSG